MKHTLNGISPFVAWLCSSGHDTYACFDTDLLRVSATWRGDFLSMTTMAQVSYNKAGNKNNDISGILGEPLTATGIYPGWLPAGAAVEDPRPVGLNPDEAGRGPIDASMGRWNGVHIAGNQAVLDYTVHGAEVKEVISGMENLTGYVRTLDISKQAQPVDLILAEFNSITQSRISAHQGRIRIQGGAVEFRLDGDLEGVRLFIDEDRYVRLSIAPSESRGLRVAIWKSDQTATQRSFTFSDAFSFPDYRTGTAPHWSQSVIVQGEVAPVLSNSRQEVPYVIDHITIPLPNPWKRNVRIAGLDFFNDGSAAVSTFEGDIWLVDGLDQGLKEITWKRFASGLYEPMSLSIVDEQIYVFGREGIIRFNDVNNDGEADYYENFSNLPIQTIESREYPHSMHPNPEGGFYVAKGAALNNGPKTNPAVMSGFRAGGPHSGTILSVSNDGRSVSLYATGLREPYMGVHPVKGWVTASDQQGNFVPSSPIYFVEKGDYYGVPATAHQNIPPEIAPPLTWVPHQVDRSGTEQVWMVSNAFGPLNGAMIHLSYGRPGLYLVYHDEVDDRLVQGAIAELPIPFAGPLMEGAVHPVDGQLYVGGFQVWDSSAREISKLYRVRYTGGRMLLPTAFDIGQEGVILHFEVELDNEAVTSLDNYALEKWNYKRTEAYGSGHFKVNGEPGTDQVWPVHADVSDDGKRVFLQISDMSDVMQMGLDYRLLSAQGDSLEHSIYFSVQNPPLLPLDSYGFSLSSAEAVAVSEPEPPEVINAPSLERGLQLYQQIGCIGCHSSDGSTEGRTGPTFKGLYGASRTFLDGTSLVADDAYIKESVWDPGARVVDGKEVEMPSYLGILDDSDIESIILYIKSLN